MRVLRFLRTVRSAAALEADTPIDTLGLDAFATEAQLPDARTGYLRGDWSNIAIIGLAALVVIESGPALLWLQGRLTQAPPDVIEASGAPAATGSSGGIVSSSPVPASSAGAPPCEAEAAQSPPAASAPRANASAPGAARAAAPGIVAGLVSIEAPVPMLVYAGGRLVGTTEADSIMLPVGDNDLELVSEPVGYRVRQTVVVEAGRTTTLRLEAPKALLHVNALPWAEVWIDDQHVGETPIGNLQQTVGTHEVVFRHPELGERRTTVLVTLREPARVSMDLRK